MDPNETLRQLRRLTEYSLTDPKFSGYGGYTWRTLVEALGERFRALDDHLSGGGKPPEEWVEGPDAIGTVQDEASASIQGPDAVSEDDGYPWCSICRKVFGKGQDRERDEHIRTAHNG